MAKPKRPPETFTGTYTAVPLRLLDSQAFKGATDRAKSLLYALLRQITGSNNGRLQLTSKWLKEHGWPSAGMNVHARAELIERGLIVQTKRGGLNIGADWFAVTWLPISNFVGLDIGAADFQQGAWGNCELQPSSRRKPPQKRVKPSDHRNSTIPTTGTVEHLAVPTTGTKTALSSTSTVPTTGNNVLIPIHQTKPARGRKRIVGKAGRSGIPKELHAEQSA